MSRENVDVVTGLVEALNRRDIDAMISSYYAPDAEFGPAIQAALEGTVYRGGPAIRAYYDEIYGVWDGLHVEVADYRDVGDTVFAEGSITTRGRASGVDRTGKVVWQRNFSDRSEALKAAGLEEE